MGATIALELIFHFHPALLGVVAGWTLRAILGPGLSAGRAAWIAGLSFAGAIAGQLVIEALGGSVDPLAAVVVIATVGIAAGAVIVARPQSRRRAPAQQSLTHHCHPAYLPGSTTNHERWHLHRQVRIDLRRRVSWNSSSCRR